MHRFLICMIFHVTLAGAAAQRALPPLMDQTREVALAESAAPPSVARNASIYLLRRGGFSLFRSGTNEFVCFVARTEPGEIEPICYNDRVHSHMLIDREFEEQTLREQGLNDEEVNIAIGKLYRTGSLRPTQNFGLAYMLSPCNRIITKEGKIAGEPPHLMFYAPYAKNADLGLGSASGHEEHSAPFILFEGEPWAFLVVRGEAANPRAADLCKETP